SRAALRVALLALLFTLAPQHLLAQSGRIKQQPGGKSPATGATRPKRVGMGGTTPQPAPTPAPRLPSGTIVMDEAPPAPPVPKNTPTPAPPDTAAGEEIDVEDVVRVTSNLVTVPASVVDPQGRAVTDLALEDFELRVDGQPRPITEISRAEVPVNLALLFDNSQSLSAAREFEKQAAVKFFRSVIRPIDRAAIYSVSTDVVLVQPLTNNVPALVRTVQHFGKPEGATRLLDAIAEAANYLRPYSGRKVIIIVSDGEDTLSNMDFDEMLRKTLAADCQVYAVQTKQIEYIMLTGEQTNANLQALAAERRMQDLATHTGGAVYTPLQTSDLDRAFAQISADLAQQYILSYYPTDERNDGRFRTLSVRVQTRPNMRVRARRGYYPRRTNERFSYNQLPPAVQTQPIADSGKQPAREVNNTAALASNINQTERRSAVPARSKRKGPSEMEDGTEQVEAVATPVKTTAPVVRRSEPAVRRSEPQPQKPTPQPAPDTNSSSSGTAPAPAAPSVSTSTKPPQAAPSRPISGGVLNGKAVQLPAPHYPPSAKNQRASGTVTVEVLLDEEGKVIEARAIEGHPALRQSAVEAARRARFSPTILSGRPVRVTGVITYRFNLSR
ncbi:MAG TPA: VWA domain-containing protein, partial [Pyrinomonadaceae bacterium]|nr:VWA domain-containing protein [Pyrinomonadaceae bacterium]